MKLKTIYRKYHQIQQIQQIKQFITKSYNKDNDAYCWYNTNRLLTPKGILEG